MKSFAKFFLGMLFMIFLFACSHVFWYTQPNMTVAWDPPTHFEDGSLIQSDHELRYEVFIDKDKDNPHGDMIPLTEQPIKETSFEIPKIEQKGHYYVGVRAVLFKGGKPVHPPRQSRISWSSSKTDTNKKPFGVYIKK